MELKKPGVAGTLESSDIMVTLEPAACTGIDIDLQSAVEKQYGRAIRNVITDTLRELGIHSAHVLAVDKGALDCVIRARVKTAAYRASEETDYRWREAKP